MSTRKDCKQTTVECREERRFESPLIGSHLWTHRSFPVKREDREDIQDKEKRRGEPWPFIFFWEQVFLETREAQELFSPSTGLLGTHFTYRSCPSRDKRRPQDERRKGAQGLIVRPLASRDSYLEMSLSGLECLCLQELTRIHFSFIP